MCVYISGNIERLYFLLDVTIITTPIATKIRGHNFHTQLIGIKLFIKNNNPIKITKEPAKTDFTFDSDFDTDSDSDCWLLTVDC